MSKTKAEYIEEIKASNPALAATFAKVGTTDPERIAVTPEQYLDFMFSKRVDEARVNARAKVSAAPLPRTGQLYFSAMLAEFETELFDALLATDKDKVNDALPECADEANALHGEAVRDDTQLVAEIIAEQILGRKEGPAATVSQDN